MSVSGVISIRKYLYLKNQADGGERQDSPVIPARVAADALRSLMTSVADHLLAGETVSDLRREMRNIISRLELEPTTEAMAAALEEAEDILLRSERLLDETGRSQAAEFQKIIAMLSQTLQALSSGSTGSIRRLQRIEQDLENTSAAEDIAAIRSRLAVCLDYVRKEARKEQAELARIAALERRFREAKEQIAVIRSGIQGRREAEEFLASAECAHAYIAVFRIEHFDSIHQRYGAPAAEELAHSFIHRRIMAIPAFERVFRWDPATIVMVTVNGKPLDAARAEIRSVISEPLEQQVQVGGRVAVLRVTHRWSLLSGSGKALSELKSEIERFAGGT